MGAQSERETSVTAAASGSCQCQSGAAIARESGGLVVATLESAQSGARAVGPPTRSRAGVSLSASTGTAVGFTMGSVSAGTVFRRARHKSGRMAVVIVLAFVACCTPHYVQSVFETIGSISASTTASPSQTNASNTSFDQNASGAPANEATGSSGDEFSDLLEFLALANGCATGALYGYCTVIHISALLSRSVANPVIYGLFQLQCLSRRFVLSVSMRILVQIFDLISKIG